MEGVKEIEMGDKKAPTRDVGAGGANERGVTWRRIERRRGVRRQGRGL
jgi:hypothetical protein